MTSLKTKKMITSFAMPMMGCLAMPDFYIDRRMLPFTPFVNF